MSRLLLATLCCILATLGLPAISADAPSPQAHHQYTGPVDIDFAITHEHAIEVTMRTERLLIRSLQPSDLKHLIALFGDPTVTVKYATGKPHTPEEVEKRLNSLVQRWQNMDPYSGFAVLRIDDSLSPEDYPFLGLVVLGYGGPPGVASLGYLFHSAYWNQGYGTEAVTAVVRDYGYLLYLKGYPVRGAPLQQIVATSREDNPACFNILEAVGMQYTGTSPMYGKERRHYAIDARALGSR